MKPSVYPELFRSLAPPRGGQGHLHIEEQVQRAGNDVCSYYKGSGAKSCTFQSFTCLFAAGIAHLNGSFVQQAEICSGRFMKQLRRHIESI